MSGDLLNLEKRDDCDTYNDCFVRGFAVGGDVPTEQQTFLFVGLQATYNDYSRD